MRWLDWLGLKIKELVMLDKLVPLLGLLFSIALNTEIIDLGNTTRDTESGLDWLDVTETLWTLL